MKRKTVSIIIFVLILAAILAIAFLIIGENLQQKYDYQAYHWEEDFYGKETYAELDIECTAEDRIAVQPVLDFADEAFSYLDGGDEHELFGELGRYSYNNYRDVVSEEHNIDFLTAKLDGDSGYLWVNSWQTGYNAAGESITGSGKHKSRWSLEKSNGEWVVSDILEHP